jgi:outer membrane PBP1 activator LpoA protein
MNTFAKLRPFVMLLSVTILPGCLTLTQTDDAAPDTSLRSFKPITSSTRDTCQTQREIAAHNSVYDSMKAGKAVIYQAPCDKGKRKDDKGEAKTS